MSDKTEGRKDDTGKLNLSLIALMPLRALMEVANVYVIGAKKYGLDNWRSGIAYTRIASAMLRHIFAWLGGETHDPVDGQHHLSSVAWGALTLMEYENTHPEMDDRIRKEAGDNGAENKPCSQVGSLCPSDFTGACGPDCRQWIPLPKTPAPAREKSCETCGGPIKCDSCDWSNGSDPLQGKHCERVHSSEYHENGSCVNYEKWTPKAEKAPEAGEAWLLPIEIYHRFPNGKVAVKMPPSFIHSQDDLSGDSYFGINPADLRREEIVKPLAHYCEHVCKINELVDIAQAKQKQAEDERDRYKAAYEYLRNSLYSVQPNINTAARIAEGGANG